MHPENWLERQRNTVIVIAALNRSINCSAFPEAETKAEHCKASRATSGDRETLTSMTAITCCVDT